MNSLSIKVKTINYLKLLEYFGDYLKAEFN